MVRLGLGLIWVLHFLPLGVLSRIGAALGMVLYALARARRHVVLTNLRLCFPELSDGARRDLARRHFRAFGRNLLEHGILWWGSKDEIQRLVRVEGLEHWQAVGVKPVIWLAPHFVGLDMGGVRLTSEYRLVSVYSHQKDPLLDAVLYHGRTRFEPSELYSRQQGIRPVVRALRKGLPFYYLPDMDFGARDSIFVPFFGVPAATITGLSRIAQLAGAVIVPCVTRQLPGGAGYVVRLYPAWVDFPGGDLEADARRMNAFIEERVREAPEQYYWLHKRFKTRPAGERNPYE
ncbi:MAG: lipid A biosynthesis acyltransferase [Betaproteobacteria bacterium]|nr:lipid A biosynthesis acyltransferase [Betaproteobacteria bacterium]MBI3054670.1 lipid A biosynthesis acyltransferase [Betaproteobacteria bacterium]